MLKFLMTMIAAILIPALAWADNAGFQASPGLWRFTTIMTIANENRTEDQKMCLGGESARFDTATYVAIVSLGSTCEITFQIDRETSSDIYLQCSNGPLKSGYLFVRKGEDRLKLHLKGVFDPGNQTEIAGEIAADLLRQGDCPPPEDVTQP